MTDEERITDRAAAVMEGTVYAAQFGVDVYAQNAEYWAKLTGADLDKEKLP